MEDDISEKGANTSSVRNRRKDKENKAAKKESLKIKLFKIYYELTRERNTGQSLAFALIIIMFIQISDLIISPIMQLPFKGTFYNQVITIFDGLRIYPLVQSSKSAETYWFAMFLFFIVIFIYLLLLIYIDFSFKIKKLYFKFPVVILQTISTAFFWLLLIPITDFFISIFECNTNGNHIIDESLVCWSVNHAFYCALFSIGLIVFFIEVVIISLLFNESRPYHTDALTRLDTNQELYLVIYRIILTCVSHYTSKSNFHWVMLALHFIVSAHLLKNYQKFIPYYFKFTSNIYGACCIGYFWVVINAILIKALESIDYRGQMIVILIGFIFLYPTNYYLRRNKVNSIILLKSQDKIKNDLELDQFITNFQVLLQEQESNEEIEMMFLGLLYMHREECQSVVCPLKTNDQLYLPLTDETSNRQVFPSKDKILHQHLVNSVFLDYMKQHQNILTTIMHTSYAYFLFYQMGNVHMSIIELNLAYKCSNTIQQQYTVFKAKHLIEENIVKQFKKVRNGTNNHNSYSDLDVTIVITFENLFRKLEKAIEQSASDHIEFWSHLDSNMIDLNVINKLGLNIINQTKKVNEIWNILNKINPNYPAALNIYGSYLHQIKNDYEQGEEYKNQYHQVKRNQSLDDFENQFDLMFADDTTVIVMSGNKEQQGKIIKTNQGILKLFGYSMFEVQGHDVNILMPPVIAIKHHYFLEKFFRTGKERILNNQLDSFAMYRTGRIFAVNMVVKPVPTLKNDIQYIAMIKRENKDFEYILTDENGKIDSISDGITKLFKLPVSFFKEHEIPIQVIVPELCDVSKSKSQNGEQITNFDAWSGYKDLRYLIPKNFSTQTSRGGATSTSLRVADTSTEDNSATGTGTGTGTQTSSSAKQKNQLTNGMMTNVNQQAFVGLRSPESLKSIANMFKNAEHKATPDKYKNNLYNHVNYSNPDFDKVIKTELVTQLYSDGELKLRIFKFFGNKKKKNLLGKDSDTTSSMAAGRDEETMLHKFGMTGMSALNDKYAFQKYQELIQQAKNLDSNFNYKKLQHDINVLKVLLERQKKIRTYGNIMTPLEYEQAELERMIQNIQHLESQIIEMHSESQKSGHNNSDYGSKGANTSLMMQNNKMQRSDDDSSNLQKAVNPNYISNNQPFGSSGKQSKVQSSLAYKDSTPDFTDNQHDNSEDKELIQEAEEEYDDNLDEDTKSANLINKMKKRKSGKDENKKVLDKSNIEDIIVGKNPKKLKENPRQEFVNTFFQQNLTKQNQLQVPNNAIPQKKGLQPPVLQKDHSKYNNLEPNNHNDLLKNLQQEKRRGTIFKGKKSDYNSGNIDKDKDNKDKQQQDQPPQMMNDAASIKVAMDDTGSVTSDTKTLIRHLRLLRNAVYEQYSPQSILNLKYSARIVMIVLIAMTIASYLFSQERYDQLKENFYNIQSSQQRMQSLTTINYNTRVCSLIQDGTLFRYRYGTTQDYFQKMKQDMNSNAIILQQAQQNLSNTKFDFTTDNKYIINAREVTVYYNTSIEIGQNQVLNIWGAVMQVVNNALKLKGSILNNFTQNNISVWYILRNSMNNILESVSKSTDGIMDDTNKLSQSNKNILMILLLVASGCLLISLFIIMPVVTKVHKDKDKLLSLFLQIDNNDVKEQLKKCKDFFTAFHNDEKNAQNVDAGFDFLDDEEKKDGEEDKKDDGKTPSSDDQKKDDKKPEQEKIKRFSRKNKKLKKYSTNYLMLLLKFLVVIAFLEGYFLYQYFQSDNFLKRSIDMINEASTIADRSFSNDLLYEILFEILATNGQAQVFNQPSTSFLVNYLDRFNSDLEAFLKVHQQNTAKHDPSFNSFFDSLIYKSVCQTIETYFSEQEQNECSKYLGGILEKGLYSANLAFWDNMREMRDSYFKSDKSKDFLTNLINSNKLIENERLNEIYFSKAYKILMNNLNQSITIQFNNRYKEVTILFAFYLIVLVIMYFVMWGRFVESMRHSLWVTKSMLAIIPLEVIEKVKMIKDFLFATSRSSISAIKE